MGDFNHGNIKWDILQSTGVEDSTFLCLVQDNFLTQHVFEPTRAARVLDIVLSSQKEFVDNVEIQEQLGSSDHNQLHFNINIKSDKTKVKQCRRDFRKGNYREIRKNLAHIDWDEKMKNKTATECWDILRGELDTAIDSYVPMKKQGKRSKKKHLSKEAFRKMRYKQNMWRVYKHTGKDEDYEVYKEALNAATNEVRKAKRNFEHKLAQNIKSESKSFYAYVRSKQNVRDKVGPLEDNAGNIITEGCLMAEELNVHFSSVFTREDTSSLPVPETKFNGSEEEKLGQLPSQPTAADRRRRISGYERRWAAILPAITRQRAAAVKTDHVICHLKRWNCLQRAFSGPLMSKWSVSGVFLNILKTFRNNHDRKN